MFHNGLKQCFCDMKCNSSMQHGYMCLLCLTIAPGIGVLTAWGGHVVLWNPHGGIRRRHDGCFREWGSFCGQTIAGASSQRCPFSNLPLIKNMCSPNQFFLYQNNVGTTPMKEINAELLTVGVQQPTPCRAPLRLPEVPSDSLDQKTSEKKTEATSHI